MSADADAIVDNLRRGGVRMTKPRRLVVEALVAAEGHATAEQLAEWVQGQAPDVHLSTVYRNLDELEKLGLVVHSHLGHGPATYHLSTAVHGHLVCQDCGFIIEVDDDMFEGLSSTALARHGFVVKPHHFAVTGLCRHCAGG